MSHIDKSQNQEAHDAAQGGIDMELNVLEVKEPLYRGRNWLCKEESFLIIGEVSLEVPKHQRYMFVKACELYRLIGDVLYMQGSDMILRRVPWHDEILHILEFNHEGVCGGHFAFKTMLRKILTEGYVWPSL